MDAQTLRDEYKKPPAVATGILPSALVLVQCDQHLGAVIAREIKVQGQALVLHTATYYRLRDGGHVMDVYSLPIVTVVCENDLWHVTIPGSRTGIQRPSRLPYMFSLITSEEYERAMVDITEQNRQGCFEHIAEKFGREDGFDFSSSVLISPKGYASEIIDADFV